MVKGITSATLLMGVIGDNFKRIPGVAVGAQKMFHNVFDHYGIDAAYMRFNIAPENVGKFVEFAKIVGMPGFGVTMPHKARVIPYLDHVTDEARTYEAVNLVIIRNGETYGYMTDGIGYCGAWDAQGISLEGRNVLIMGAGAITPIISHELAKRGVAKFTILNRTVNNAQHVADIITKNTGKPATAGPMTPEMLDECAKDTGLLLQCTSLGMADNGTQHPYLGFIDLLPKDALVSDVIVNPLETELLKKARQNGHRTTDGADMLTYQLPETFHQYFGDTIKFGDDLVALGRAAFGR